LICVHFMDFVLNIFVFLLSCACRVSIRSTRSKSFLSSRFFFVSFDTLFHGLILLSVLYHYSVKSMHKHLMSKVVIILFSCALLVGGFHYPPINFERLNNFAALIRACDGCRALLNPASQSSSILTVAHILTLIPHVSLLLARLDVIDTLAF